MKQLLVRVKFIRRLLLPLSLVWGCNAFAQSWENNSALKRPRFEASAVQYKDDIYVFNGFGAGIRIEPTVEKFDAGTKSWSVISTTSVQKGNAVTHNGIVRVGNEVWLIGGRKGNHPGRVSNQVWIFNLSNLRWSAGPSLPLPSAAGGAALVNNRIHWIGGLDPLARCDVPNHFVYDLGSPNAGWQNITAVAGMPTPRNHFSTVVHNGLIYTIGGQFGHDNCPGKRTQDTNLVHAFNPQNNEWTRKADLPTPQSHMEPSTLVIDGAIYVVGGETNGNKIFRYAPSRNQWDTVGNLPETLLASVARVIDNRLVVASGGAPNAQSPTNRTRSTNITPLLLPGASANSAGGDSNASNTVMPSGENQPNSNVPVTTPDSLISLEAEYFDNSTETSTHKWVITNRAGSSNNAAVVTTPDNGFLSQNATNSPELSYFALFDRPGTWYMWVRGWGDTNAAGEGRSDSLHAGLNGELIQSADKIDQFPVSWHWSNSTRDNVRASVTIPTVGLHAVNLWMREDGLIVDKIVLTMDPDYVPSGAGPDHNDGSGSTGATPVTPTTGNGNAVGGNDSSDTDNTGDNSSPPAPINVAPLVAAGNNVITTVNTPLSLNGNVSDDGLPSNQLNINWVALTNASSVSIASANTVDTTVTFSAPGTYTLALTADDGSLVTIDSVTVTVAALSDDSVSDNLPETPDTSGANASAADPLQAQSPIRINAGGPQIIANGIVWIADNPGSHGFVTTGNAHPFGQNINTSGIPSDIPAQLFQSERWDGLAGPPMQWDIPVVPGNYEVRLFFSENFGPTQITGGRVFTVTIEAQTVLSQLDVFAEVGANNALIETFMVSADANLDIDFSHITENPAIKAIEILPVVSDPLATVEQDDTPEGIVEPENTAPVTPTPVTPAPVTPDTVSSSHQSISGLVSIEVENFVTRSAASSRQWVESDRANASGDASMITNPDRGLIKFNQAGSPEMTYRVRFDEAGTYTVWMRGWGDTLNNEGKSDSVHVGINGTLSGAQALQNFPSRWSWSREKRGGGNATLVVPIAGEHEINIWMREDGLTIDKLVLTRDNNFIPTGQGPAETIGPNNLLGSASSGDISTVTSNASVNESRAWELVATSDGSSVVPRHESGGVAFEGKLYVVGGRGVRAISVYDPFLQTWESRSAPPQPVHHVQPVVFGDRIWMIGGFTGVFPDEIPVAEIMSYTPATDTWTVEGEIPVNRRRGSVGAALHDGLIYLVGGNTNGHRPGAKSWFDSFNPETGEWQVLPDAPSSRDHAHIAVSNDLLVVAAGRQSAFPNTFGNMLADTDVYNFATDSWALGSAIPTGRAGTMAVVVGDEVVVVGGESAGLTPARSNVEAYNTTTDSWRQLHPLNVGRHGGAAAILDEYIHVVSGSEQLGGAPESTIHEILSIAP